MSTVTVWTDCGETWSTCINGKIGEIEAISYFLGQWFNIGPRYLNDEWQEDHMVLVTGVQFNRGLT